jgi:hypothetical protein
LSAVKEVIELEKGNGRWFLKAPEETPKEAPERSRRASA